MKEWDELDKAAKVNLTPNNFLRFLEYKERLRKEGQPWKDAFDILSGFIWDASEEPSDDAD